MISRVSLEKMKGSVRKKKIRGGWEDGSDDGGGLFDGSDVGGGADLGGGHETCPTHLDGEEGLRARAIGRGLSENGTRCPKAVCGHRYPCPNFVKFLLML